MKSNDVPSSDGATDQTFRLGALVDRCKAPGRASWLDIPASAGIYIVFLPNRQDALEFNQSAGEASSVPVDTGYLRRKWGEITKHAATDIIYIGKASSLRKRIRHLARFGAGLTAKHRGGEWMWQIAGIYDAQLIVKMCQSGKETEWERRLLDDFYAEHRGWPLANRSGGEHGQSPLQGQYNE